MGTKGMIKPYKNYSENYLENDLNFLIILKNLYI